MIRLVTIFVLCFCSMSIGANHYIRDGGSGDGSAWDNALDALPATLTRDDTYYIADGDYVQYTFDDAVDGTKYITIKKATVADHGTETGWDNAYGDGQAVFEVPDTGNTEPDNTAWWVRTNYWIFDGQVGGGPGDWDGDTNPHGFLLTVDVDNFVYDIYNTNFIRLGGAATQTSVDFVEIRHVEITLGSATQEWGAEVDYNIFGITASLSWDDIVGTTDGCYNVTISECYFNELHVNIHATSGHNWIIENNYFWKNHDNDDGGSRQENGMKQYAPHDLTIRYNLFYNQNGTGSITMSCGTQNVEADFPDKNVENVYIYGNIFYNDDTLGNDTGTICVTLEHQRTQAEIDEGDNYITNLYVINNTFYDNFGVNTSSGVRTEQDADDADNPDSDHYPPTISNFVVKNNLFYDSDAGRGYGDHFNNVSSFSYNWFYDCDDSRNNQEDAGTNRDDEYVALQSSGGIKGTGSPTTNASNLDFSLTGAIEGDDSVGATYNTDMLGNTRGDDGAWDMGALEFEADVAAPTPDPATWSSAPAAVNSISITMTATTGTDASGPVEYSFVETSGNSGGTSSGWTENPVYVDYGLSPSTQYTYTVQMRDSVPNTGTASSGANATTDAATGSEQYLLGFKL